MSEKRYYWLKLMKDFFTNPKIKKLRKLAGGDTFTIIYLKLQLLSLDNEGVLIFQGIENTFEEEMALTIDEDVENVSVTLNYLISQNLMEVLSKTEYLLTETQCLIGSESSVTKRVRKHREQKALQCNANETICNTEIDIEKEIDKEIDINKEEKIPYKEIIDCLNKFAKTNYRHTNQVTKDKIKARWNDGFRLNDFETVIKNKCSEWMGTDMEKYLRPKTLFGNNFESYLNQKVSKENSNTDKVPDWYKNTGETEPDDELLKQVEEMKRGLNRET
jgi:uncharacterized phage protein (TIGR02220 family)/predicted phage replisome organizer|nr:MAG TPA: replisome organizer protein [Caudoviricetes sp.]